MINSQVHEIKFIKGAFGFENFGLCAFNDKFKTTAQSFRNMHYYLRDTKQTHTWIAIYIPSATNKYREEEGLQPIKEYTGHIAAFQELINVEALNYKDYGLDERWPLGIPAGRIYRFSKPCLPLLNLGEDFAKLVQQTAHQSAAAAFPTNIERAILSIISEETLLEVQNLHPKINPLNYLPPTAGFTQKSTSDIWI